MQGSDVSAEIAQRNSEFQKKRRNPTWFLGAGESKSGKAKLNQTSTAEFETEPRLGREFGRGPPFFGLRVFWLVLPKRGTHCRQNIVARLCLFPECRLFVRDICNRGAGMSELGLPAIENDAF